MILRKKVSKLFGFVIWGGHLLAPRIAVIGRSQISAPSELSAPIQREFKVSRKYLLDTLKKHSHKSFLTNYSSSVLSILKNELPRCIQDIAPSSRAISDLPSENRSVLSKYLTLVSYLDGGDSLILNDKNEYVNLDGANSLILNNENEYVNLLIDIWIGVIEGSEDKKFIKKEMEDFLFYMYKYGYSMNTDRFEETLKKIYSKNEMRNELNGVISIKTILRGFDILNNKDAESQLSKTLKSRYDKPEARVILAMFFMCAHIKTNSDQLDYFNQKFEEFINDCDGPFREQIENKYKMVFNPLHK